MLAVSPDGLKALVRRLAILCSSLGLMAGVLVQVLPASGEDLERPGYGSGPAPRLYVPMAPDVNGNVLLFGGCEFENVQYFGDTWIWDGQAWTELHPAHSPQPRCGHEMAYDAARREVVLFGGFSKRGYFRHTWTWDGADWTKHRPPTTPSSRYHMGLAYDATNEEVVLFGGADGFYLGDTWTWDGTNWTKHPRRPAPFERFGTAMAYDDVGREVLLFGGAFQCYEQECPLRDTWTWDGVMWNQERPASSPPARALMSAAYDAARQRVVLFGGLGYSGRNLRDTWTWDGQEWNREIPARSPPSRFGFGLAYHAAMQEVVLFGGFRHGTYLGDTWTWDGADWTQQ